MLKTWRVANVGATLRLAVLAVAFVAVAFMSPATAAGKRVALVIGNSAYKSVSPLPNPVNDAAAIAKSLAKIGFNVTHLSDLNGSDLRRALQDFEDTAAGAEIAIVFYAGHGIELNGENYLIPVDAALLRDSHVEDETIPLSRVMRAIEGASSLNLVILDACRDNPFAQNMQRSSAQRSIGRGLARVEPSGRTLVAYAAKGGTTADDGDGEHSPFAAALLNHLETPGLEVTFLFRQVHDDVLAATAQRQEPFLYGSLGATPIYLVPPGETPATETPPPAADTTPPSSSASGNALMEADYLAALRTNTEEAYRAFLEKHPNSTREAQVNGLLAALVENEVWTEVSDEDTVAAYQRYLAAFATGAYAAEAKTRMEHLFEERRQLASRTAEEQPAAPAGVMRPSARRLSGDRDRSGRRALGAAPATPRCKRGREHAAGRRRYRHRPVRECSRLQLSMVRGSLSLRRRLGLRPLPGGRDGERKRRERDIPCVRHCRRRRSQHA